MLPCPWSVTGKGVRCKVYAVLSVCLSRTGFHGHSHSIPGHLWRRVTAGSRSQGRRETRRFTSPQELDTQNVEEMPQMSKSSSSQVRIQVAARFTVLHYLVAPRPWHNLCCTCVRTMRAEFTTQENWINVFSWPLFRPILVSIYNWYLWRANT